MEIALGKVNSAASFCDEWVVMAQFSAWVINLQAAARGNPNHRDGRVVQLRAELVESRRHCPANRCQAINIAKDNRGCLKQGGSVPPGHCSGLYGARLLQQKRRAAETARLRAWLRFEPGLSLCFYLPEVDAAAVDGC